jgi:hypothetical protein
MCKKYEGVMQAHYIIMRQRANDTQGIVTSEAAEPILSQY